MIDLKITLIDTDLPSDDPILQHTIDLCNRMATNLFAVIENGYEEDFNAFLILDVDYCVRDINPWFVIKDEKSLEFFSIFEKKIVKKTVKLLGTKVKNFKIHRASFEDFSNRLESTVN